MTGSRRMAHRGVRQLRGFTLVELMLVVAIIGLMSGLAVSSYAGYVEKARVARAVAEIAGMATVLDAIVRDEDAPLPDTLAEADQGSPLDPWGNPYRYLRLEGALPPGQSAVPAGLPPVAAPPAMAQARKDGFLAPLNTDYDLYSMGADGESQATLNHPRSRDDVIRAANGAFIGLAEDF